VRAPRTPESGGTKGLCRRKPITEVARLEMLNIEHP
jgi:hypothetical protein